jgi:hypothetical protein
MPTNGFYQVGGKRFISKFDAIYLAQQLNSHVSWNFHDAVFSKLDWSTEPEQSLCYFYTRRALELRQQYDYLILHYSGGNDSNQILQSFIDAGVAIDEIVIRTLDRDRANDISDLSAENTFGGYPIAYNNALHVKNTRWPNLKISEFKINDIAIQNGLQKNWIQSSVVSLDLWSTSWREYDLYTKSYKLSDRGLKVAHILGVDKPLLYQNKHGWHLRFLDKTVGRHITSRSQSDVGLNIELFFWGETCGPMLIKQAHMLLNALQQNHITAQALLGRDTLSQNAVAKIIYSNNFALWAEKKTNAVGIINEISLYYYRDNNTDQYTNWKNTLQELSYTMDNKFTHGTVLDDITGTWSKSYLIKSFNQNQ